VIVVHRLSTIGDADAIAVLEQGRIVEHGSHDELVDRHCPHERKQPVCRGAFSDGEERPACGRIQTCCAVGGSHVARSAAVTL
jgi:ABC-type glutathione transport system ATPase component